MTRTAPPLGIHPKTGLPLCGPDTIAALKERTDTILLSFSAGKDSIAAWLRLKDHFQIVPVYMYLVPNLSFVEDALRYYESVFDTHIIRMPSPRFYEMLGEMVFQPPQNCAVLEELGLPGFRYTNDQVFQLVRDDWKLPKSAWCAVGVRAADSPNRRASINKYGSTREKRDPHVFYPIWDMKKDELIHTIRSAGVKLPIDYKLFARSYDGIDLRFLYPIREHFPEDYARILEFFPLAELEIKRYEYHLEHQRGALAS